MQISGIAEGSGKGRISWAIIREAQGDFILPQYLPNGITLTQYHHIRVNDANALLQHWVQRQAAGGSLSSSRTISMVIGLACGLQKMVMPPLQSCQGPIGRRSTK